MTTPTFYAANQLWPLRITPPVARRVRDATGIDLYAISSPPSTNPFFRLAEQPLLLADVLWTICQPQAEMRGLTRDEFEESIWPEIDSATAKLIEGVIAAFPEQKKRGLRKLVDAQNAALEKVLEKLEPKIDDLIDQAAEDAAAGILESTRTSSPTN